MMHDKMRNTSYWQLHENILYAIPWSITNCLKDMFKLLHCLVDEQERVVWILWRCMYRIKVQDIFPLPYTKEEYFAFFRGIQVILRFWKDVHKTFQSNEVSKRMNLQYLVSVWSWFKFFQINFLAINKICYQCHLPQKINVEISTQRSNEIQHYGFF